MAKQATFTFTSGSSVQVFQDDQQLMAYVREAVVLGYFVTTPVDGEYRVVLAKDVTNIAVENVS